MIKTRFKDWTLAQIINYYPYAADFFTAMVLPLTFQNTKLGDYLLNLNDEFLEDIGLDRDELAERFDLFMDHMAELRQESPFKIDSITIMGGKNKSGEPENVQLTIKAGEIICVVGPTGSGKSRLLADIEWMAQGDTPTGRRVLLNNHIPPMEWRFSLEHKLVAQLSQNMNFVVDMTVFEFLKMHADSRRTENSSEKADIIWQQANLLAGETFAADTPVTSLSGGQSRALMIADTAFLSSSPIVLIDEIENAGIDRKGALNLLVNQEKIVLMATHDPTLALMGHKRIVIKNGGIEEIIVTSPVEQDNLAKLECLDQKLLELRNMIRAGKKIEMDLISYFDEHNKKKG